MRKISRRTFYQTRMKADGTEYKLFTYEVVDELGNKDNIDSLREYEKGARVEVWHDAKYNKMKMRLYREKRPLTERGIIEGSGETPSKESSPV